MHIAIAKCDLFLYYCNAKEISFYNFRDTKLYTKHKCIFSFSDLGLENYMKKVTSIKLKMLRYTFISSRKIFLCLHHVSIGFVCYLLLRKIFLCLEHVSLCLVYYSNKRKNRSPSFLNKWKK